MRAIPRAVDPAVAAPACYLDMGEPGFSEHALDEPLERRRAQRLGEQRVKLLFPFLFFGNLGVHGFFGDFALCFRFSSILPA